MSDINVTVQDEIVNIDVIDTPVVVEVTNSPGPAGAGVAAGGTTGQVLAKASNTNYDTVWVNQSGGVPYSGATGNVNLGEYELKAGQVTLDTSPTGTAAVGTIRWNDTTGTSETTLKGGNVIIKNGVDLVARVVNKVTPNTTLTKAAYQAVRVSGAQGQRLAIELAQANNDAGSADTIGLVTETIATNQEGFIMTVGQLEGINTTGSLQGETWVDGDVLYLSPTTAGAITNVKPTAVTGHIVVIGYVEYAHANNGKIYVKVMNGWELDELHNVSIVTPSNNQGLFYNSSNSLWENKSITTALGYTPVPTTRNITINGVTYDLSADRTYTISTGISGSGAAGQVTYWTGASAVSGSNNLFWDNANGRLGIGTNVPAYYLEVKLPTGVNTYNNGIALTRGTGVFIIGNGTGNTTNYIPAIYAKANYDAQGFAFTASVFSASSTAPAMEFQSANSANAGAIGAAQTAIRFANWTTQIADFKGNGNVMIGTTSDLGTRLGVVGDTLLRGSGNDSSTFALTVQSNNQNNILRVRNDQKLLIGQASTSAAPAIYAFEGTTGLRSLRIGIQSAGSLTPIPAFNINQENDYTYTTGTGEFTTITANFLPTSGTGTLAYLSLKGTINQTGGANGITRGLYVNPTLTAAADFRAIETTAGNVLFGSNFFWDNTNGRLGIGTNAPTNSLTIGAATAASLASSNSSFYSASSGGSNVMTFVAASSVDAQNRPVYSGFRARGALSSPTAVLNGDSILSFLAGAYDGTAIQASSLISFDAAANATSGNAPININFLTGSSGAGRATRMTIFSGGNVSIGTTSDLGTRLGVVGDTILRGSGATSATTALTVQNSSSTNLFSVRNDGVAEISSNGGRLRLTQNVAGSTFNGIDFTTSGTVYASFIGNQNSGEIRLSTVASYFPTFYSSGSEAMRISTSRNLLIGTVTDIASSILTINSTTQGFLPPRMTTTQKNAIATPAAGLVVYDTTLNKLCVYTTAWETITSI